MRTGSFVVMVTTAALTLKRRGVGSRILSFFSLILFILRERERERERKSMSRGGAGRERENPKQAPHHWCRAGAGLELMNHEIMT